MTKRFFWWIRRTFFAWTLDPTPELLKAKIVAHVARLEKQAAVRAASMQISRANYNAISAELREYRKALKEWK
jgi:hypothetical protein